MTPEEVETRITAPIEVELLGIPNQTMLRSMTKYALADITLDFAEGTDIYWARQQVADRLDAVSRLAAGGRRGRHRADDDAARRDVHVHGRRAAESRRAAHAARVGHPAGAAHGARRRRRQRRSAATSAPSRSSPTPCAWPRAASTCWRSRQRSTANNRNDGAGRINEGEEALLVRSEGSDQGRSTTCERIVVRVENGIPISVGRRRDGADRLDHALRRRHAERRGRSGGGSRARACAARTPATSWPVRARSSRRSRARCPRACRCGSSTTAALSFRRRLAQSCTRSARPWCSCSCCCCCSSGTYAPPSRWPSSYRSRRSPRFSPCGSPACRRT